MSFCLTIVDNAAAGKIIPMSRFRDLSSQARQQNYVKTPYNCLSKQGQITPQIRVTGLLFLPLYTPLRDTE